MSDVLRLLIPSLFGAFFGALFALLSTSWRERRKQRDDTTRAFINEFFSSDFLRHRIAVAALRRKILKGEVTVDAIARGYWYPGIEDAYAGEQHGDFNEHQHLEAYLGFLVRLTHAHSRGQIDDKAISSALKTSYLWHGDVTNAVAVAARSQVSQHAGAIVPIWISAVDATNNIMQYEGKRSLLSAGLKEEKYLTEKTADTHSIK